MRNVARQTILALSVAAVTFGTAASSVRAQSHEQFYEDNQQMFTSLGISREKAIQIGLYLEGVGIVGMCREYMAADDVAYWRTWADGLRTHENPLARRIPEMAEKEYADGVADQRSRRLDETQCGRVWHSFQSDWLTADRRLTASVAAHEPSASEP